MDEDEFVYLVDGRKVPVRCVKALDEFEKTWPGASFHRARAAIVAEVLKAYNKEKK